ncbi:MAG: hypothetical protein U0842_25500 [Candidatus Binatia bacterium]|jgi:hypothetical protein
MSETPAEEVEDGETVSSPPGAEHNGTQVVPAFGLALPRLPSDEQTAREQKFMFDGLGELPRRGGMTLSEAGEAAEEVLQRFDDRATVEDAPLTAIGKLGLLALRPSRWEDLSTWQPRPGSSSAFDVALRNLQRVRGAVWAGVEHWQEVARWGPSLEARRAALARLRMFGKMLLPTTRGKRNAIGPPPDILVLGYRQLLFRLRLGRAELTKATAKAPVTVAILQEVARDCGLFEEWVRSWLFFDDRLERKVRPLTDEQMARELLGRIVGMDPDSIATMMSRGRRGRSRRESPS